VIRAALSGQGVALGRMPLVGALVADGSLKLLFPDSAASNRAYWVIASPAASERPEVGWFVEWLLREGAAQVTFDQTSTSRSSTQRHRGQGEHREDRVEKALRRRADGRGKA